MLSPGVCMRSGVVATVGAFNPDDSQRLDGPGLLGAIRFARGLLLAFAVVAGCELHAQPPGGENTRATADRRPVVALVLSGGGARGAAHVGVIKVLEQYGVPIDIIAGTSAGAIVGGLYAAGKSAQQIEEALLSIDWQQVLSDAPPRARRTQENRSEERSTITREVAGIDNLQIRPPAALIQGQQLDVILRNLTLAASGVDDFDRMRVRYRAVATDAVTGDPVVLRSGDLALAMRASMAVPAVFSGVEIGGRLLIDGGLSNNIPISVAIEMGADVVIAVDISTPLRNREQIRSVLGMMDQMTGFLTVRNTQEQLSKLRASDVLITPAVDGLSSVDLRLASTVVASGAEAARRVRDRLEQIASSARPPGLTDTVALPEKSHGQGAFRVPVIRFVRFETTSALREPMLRAKLGDLEDKPLDLEALKLGLDRLYATDAFESVRYRLVEEQGESGLIVTAVPRSWGRDALRLGLRLASERRKGSDFDLAAAYEARAINDLNGHWLNEVQFGQSTLLATELYQPLHPAEYWFTKIRLAHSEILRKLYRANDAQAEYLIARTGASFALGANVDRHGDVRAGWRRSTGRASVSVGAADIYSAYRFDESIAFVSAEFDNLDSIAFPRSGGRLMVMRSHSLPGLGASADYRQVEVKATLARALGAHSLIAGTTVGVTTGGQAPIEARYTMGGLFTMPGYNLDALVGQQLVRSSVTYIHSAGRWAFLPVYIGAAWHVGNVWEDRAAISGSRWLQGRAIFAGTDTLVGPIYIGVGMSPGIGSAVYLNLGVPGF